MERKYAAKKSQEENYYSDKYKDRLEQKVTADVSIKKEISELSDDELRDIAIRGRTGTVKAQSSAPALN